MHTTITNYGRGYHHRNFTDGSRYWTPLDGKKLISDATDVKNNVHRSALNRQRQQRDESAVTEGFFFRLAAVSRRKTNVFAPVAKTEDAWNIQLVRYMPVSPSDSDVHVSGVAPNACRMPTKYLSSS
ncbi:hypothetical protein J6590_035870 [Homalodisca vitripennis]|nr:hypothetical protein J6590_035870 [Homalodisca vitripennis]